MKLKLKNVVALFIASIVFGVGISYGKLYLFHIALAAVVIFYLVSRSFVIKVPKVPTRYHQFVILMLVWYALTCFWSINLFYSFRYLVYIVCGASIVLILTYYGKNLENQNHIFRIAAIIFGFEILISLLEISSLVRWPISPFSSYLEMFGRVSKVEISIRESSLYKLDTWPTGFEWNPNNLAAAISLLIPFFLFHKKLMVKIVGITISMFIIVMAGSRGVFLAVLLAFGLYFVFLNKKYYEIPFQVFIGLFFIVSGIIILQYIEFWQFEEIRDTFLSLGDFISDSKSNDGSINVRKQLLQHGVEAIKETYGIGVGGGGSVAVQERFGGIGERHTASMHNFWLEMAVDAGILFTLAYVIWYLSMIFKLYSIAQFHSNERIRYYASACCLGLASFIIGSISTSSVIYFLPMWLLFGFSIVTINNAKRLEKVSASIPEAD